MLGLTHWGRVTHICVSKLIIIGSNNGLSPGRRQAIFWTNAGILLNWNLGIKFNAVLGEIDSFSFSKMHLKISSAKWRLFGLGLNELISRWIVCPILMAYFILLHTYVGAVIQSDCDWLSMGMSYNDYWNSPHLSITLSKTQCLYQHLCSHTLLTNSTLSAHLKFHQGVWFKCIIIKMSI